MIALGIGGFVLKGSFHRNAGDFSSFLKLCVHVPHQLYRGEKKERKGEKT